MSYTIRLALTNSLLTRDGGELVTFETLEDAHARAAAGHEYGPCKVEGFCFGPFSTIGAYQCRKRTSGECVAPCSCWGRSAVSGQGALMFTCPLTSGGEAFDRVDNVVAP